MIVEFSGKNVIFILFFLLQASDTENSSWMELGSMFHWSVTAVEIL